MTACNLYPKKETASYRIIDTSIQLLRVESEGGRPVTYHFTNSSNIIIVLCHGNMHKTGRSTGAEKPKDLEQGLPVDR